MCVVPVAPTPNACIANARPGRRASIREVRSRTPRVATERSRPRCKHEHAHATKPKHASSVRPRHSSASSWNEGGLPPDEEDEGGLSPDEEAICSDEDGGKKARLA